ncbi:MAG: dihydroxyacetone kinase subunit DhaK [Opitutales bacterium]|nr:dihydroxyacetone kinase subunit DhaK [Opitutales bacterium]
MQKIINDPQTVVDEALEGFVKANKHIVEVTDNERVIKSTEAPKKGKVGIVTGGGSGHKPAFVGYVGKNMVDAVACGEIFSSPPAMMFYDAFKEANGGAGIACLYGNYAGDNMNVKMAIEMAKGDGIEVKTVVANDDVPSAPKERLEDRRGVAGEILMWKVGAAKADMGASLDEVIAAAQKTIDQTRSMGVGLSPCTIPEVGKPNFTVEPGKMEVGIGHHGEPGIEVADLEPSKQIAKRMVDLLVPDLPYEAGDDVVVLVSGLGSTPPLEQFIFFNDINALLEEKGLNIYRSYVGDYFTSLEMAGITLTVLKLDDELKQCIDYPADCWGLTQFGK